MLSTTWSKLFSTLAASPAVESPSTLDALWKACLDSTVDAYTFFVLSTPHPNLPTSSNIPIQLSARPKATGGTNASRARFANSGIKTILLGIPCRYMHTPVEMCDMRDVEAAIALIVEYIKMIH